MLKKGGHGGMPNTENYLYKSGTDETSFAGFYLNEGNRDIYKKFYVLYS